VKGCFQNRWTSTPAVDWAENPLVALGGFVFECRQTHIEQREKLGIQTG
jgi:hypothetical protein